MRGFAAWMAVKPFATNARTSKRKGSALNTVRVQAQRPYEVMLGHGVLDSVGDLLLARQAACRVALVCDATVWTLYGKTVLQSLEAAGFEVFPYTLLPGEATKSLLSAERLLQFFAEIMMTRGDVVVALGGGVTGDVAGFAAAIYMRGINLVNIPTTLLAAVDASVGGKTGVNLPQGKNLVGAFWQPSLVVCDCGTFDSLPYDVFLDGVSECLKYGVICDRALFEKIVQGALDGDCLDVVTRCVEIKAEIVAADEKDTGRRQLLNLGHTIGHAIEVYTEYAVSHGKAVAMGMAGVARMAEGLGLCAMGCAGLLVAMLDRLGLPSDMPDNTQALAEIAMRDKKRHGDKVTLVLPLSIGQCVLHAVPVSDFPRLFRLACGARA